MVAPAGMTLMKFARGHLFKEEVRPFMYGMIVAFVSLGGMSLNSDKKARAESKYLNPPTHH